MDYYNKIKEELDSIEEDVRKFYDKGNKAAGTRVRKAMQNVKQHAQDLRNDIQDRKNAE